MKGLIAPYMPPKADSGPATILVIDDDADMRALLHLHLEGAGYRVVSAEDAVAAGHAVTAHVPDLIIADFKLPYMNGDEFIGALRADATIPDLPVIFITGAETSRELSGRTFGYPLLVKPLLASELLATVATLLEARKRAHASASSGSEYR